MSNFVNQSRPRSPVAQQHLNNLKAIFRDTRSRAQKAADAERLGQQKRSSSNAYWQSVAARAGK